MANTKYSAATEAAKLHRQAAGKQVRTWRQDQGLTQRELAKLIDVDYYTFISQVETGAARVPPEAMADWAKALKIDLADFAKTLLRHYDPHMFHALYTQREP